MDPMSGIATKASEESGVQLGNAIQNAYSLYYMRQAYDQLYCEIDVMAPHPGWPDRTLIQPTHLYIRVHPVDTTQVNLLVDDSTVDAFPYPLDRELIGCGEYVPSEEEEGYVYAVVPINWDGLHFLDYAVIDTCCIPDDDDDRLEDVERRALQNAGLTLYEEPKSSGRPGGDIKVRNTVTEDFEGVKGVMVVMNTLVRVRHAYTDESGHYSQDTKFYSNVNYTLSFTNHDNYKIWKNNLSVLPATLALGVHSPRGYTYYMDTTSHGWQLSTVHNAAYIYRNYLCSEFHLDLPPKGMRLWLMPTDVFGRWTASTPMWHHRIYDYMTFESFTSMLPLSATAIYLWVLPDMFIFRNDRNTADHYRTLFHELSHASHCMHAGATYWEHLVWNTIIHGGYGDMESRPEYVGVGEMWAYYADHTLTNYSFRSVNGVLYDVLTHTSHDTSWFRPDILDSVAQCISNDACSTLFQCLTPTNSTHLTMREEIKNRVSDTYHERIGELFEPLIEE